MDWNDILMNGTKLMACWVLWELGRAIRLSSRRQITGDLEPVLGSVEKMKKLLSQIDTQLTQGSNGTSSDPRPAGKRDIPSELH